MCYQLNIDKYAKSYKYILLLPTLFMIKQIIIILIDTNVSTYFIFQLHFPILQRSFIFKYLIHNINFSNTNVRHLFIIVMSKNKSLC